MADLRKVRLQVIDPATGAVIENVDAKTSVGAVYLPDGTTLKNWMANSDETYTETQKKLAAHLAMKHVDVDKIDDIVTGIVYDDATGKFTFTKHNGTSTEVDTLLEKLAINFDLVDGENVDGYEAGDLLLEVTLDDGTKKYADLSELIDVYEGETNAEIAVDITDGKVSATLVDGGIARTKIDAAFEKQIADLEAAVGTGGSIDDKIKTAVEALDAEISTADDSIVNVTISEVDGKLTTVTATIDDETFDEFGAAEKVQGETTETVASVDKKVEDLTESSKVTVEKLAAATEGFIASYVVKQNNVQVGATIDIPKDYLVKSAELKTADDAIVSGSDTVVAAGHKYIDFVVNTVEGSGNESHIYLDVNNLVDVYTVAADAEMVQLALDTNTNTFSAEIVDGSITYEKLNAALKEKVDYEYTLEAATTEKLGGVKIGAGIAVTADGTISTENVTFNGVAQNLNIVVDTDTVLLNVKAPAETIITTAVGTAIAAQTVVATKTGVKADIATLSYQWYKKTIGTDVAFVTIDGAQSDTLLPAFVNVAAAGTTMYYCCVKASGEGVVSDPVASKPITVIVG